MACTVTVTNGTLEQPEIQAYIDRAAKKFGREPRHIDIKVCGDEVELDYDLGAQPFHRIRRITGYLGRHAGPFQQRQTRRGTRSGKAHGRLIF